MRIVLRSDSEQFTIVRAFEARGDVDVRELPSEHHAASFLHMIIRDDLDIRSLRTELEGSRETTDVMRMSDREVIRAFAALLAGGLLKVVASPVPRASLQLGTEPATGKAEPGKAPPLEHKPAPIVPQEYPILARVESNEILSSTRRLVADLQKLVHALFNRNPPPSQLAPEYIGTAKETALDTRRSIEKLDMKIERLLYRAGSLLRPRPAIPLEFATMGKTEGKAASGIVQSFSAGLKSLLFASRDASTDGAAGSVTRGIGGSLSGGKESGKDKQLPPGSKDAEPTPTLSDPRWSSDRVEVGANVEAIFTYASFKKSQRATLSVFEHDKSSAKTRVAKVTTTVPAGSGEHKVKWKRDAKAAQTDLAEDAAAGDSGPVEYRFMIETRDTKCPDESGPLWLTNTVKVDLKEVSGSKHEKERVVVLKDALGEEHRATSKGGKAKFEKVLVGPVEIRLVEPRFSSLAWGASKVPVGKPVDAVFSYEDAAPGTKVEVVIHEFNADGTSTEVKRLDVKLDAESGEAKASFTRTEDEAQDDMAADEREGDTGPVEYRFFVEAEAGDGTGGEASGPLFLTYTLSLKLEDTEAGKTLPDGMELIAIGADGTEHRAKLAGGQAKFEGVVCGPVTVKLVPKA